MFHCLQFVESFCCGGDMFSWATDDVYHSDIGRGQSISPLPTLQYITTKYTKDVVCCCKTKTNYLGVIPLLTCAFVTKRLSEAARKQKNSPQTSAKSPIINCIILFTLAVRFRRSRGVRNNKGVWQWSHAVFIWRNLIKAPPSFHFYGYRGETQAPFFPLVRR